MMAQSIPLVDLQAQYQSIGAEIDRAMRRVIETTSFILGPEVANFEQAFAAYCGVEHCVGVSSGTSALELALRALGVGAGDEVITAAHTFIATAEAISAVGAVPIFADIDTATFNLAPDAVVQAITPRTRAVMPVHLYGQPADMTRMAQIAREYGLWLIEDAAQAHGASWQGERAGARSDAACFSFYPGKNLGAYGDAGAVVTKQADVAQQVRLLRNHGRRDKYLHEQIGFGERMDALQAAILGAKLPYLDGWIEARNRLAARYNQELAEFELELPQTAAAARHAWHLYVVRTPRRDEMLAHLQRQGIGAGVHYPVPLHLQPAYAALGYRRGELPVTEAVADSCLSLPLYPEMSEAQQDRVVAAIAEFVGARQSA